MSERAALTKTSEKKAKESVFKKPKENLSQSINSPVEQILHLQQTLGNQAVQRLINSATIQAKLKIGQHNDKYELEADRIADKVMSMPEPKRSLVNSHSSLVQRESTCPECPEKEEIQTKPLAEQITPLVQRQAEEEEEPIQTKLIQPQAEEEEEPVQTKLLQRQEAEEEEEPVQTKLQRQAEEEEEEPVQAKQANTQTPAATSNIEFSVNSLKGGGQPLPKSTRSYFEPRFGVDFSQVRLHTDSKAADTAKSINAKAFTKGKDVVFASGQYSPGTSSGKRLMAHELTHVVQQHGPTLGQLPAIAQREQSQSVPTLYRSESLSSKRFSGNRRLEAAFDNRPPISMGEPNREAARLLQLELVRQCFDMPKSTREDGTLDGIFGPETNETVKAFQRKHNLVVDGLVGHDTMGVLDRCAEAPAPPRWLYDGRIVVTKFQVENAPFAPNRAIQSAWLDLEFVPNEGSRFARPGSINWFQTVRTNSRGGTQPVPPEDEYPIHPPVEFVDGSLDKQRAHFWGPPAFKFHDIPGRENLRDRKTLWRAETSCVGITAQGLDRLLTFTWGFTIDRIGRGNEIPLTTTESPSTYHMQKFGELLARVRSEK
jgi:peptidoglycan hydrolase-like protein with peptidoglycan-binding domain